MLDMNQRTNPTRRQLAVLLTSLLLAALLVPAQASSSAPPPAAEAEAPAPGASPQEQTAAVEAGDNWPAFRGPSAAGVSDGHRLPAGWDPDSGENVRWSVPIEGTSHSSPIVWGDRVFLITVVATDAGADQRDTARGNGTMADGVERSWRMLALDRDDGEVLWQHEARRGVPSVSRHEKGTHANATPATDGRYLVAIYASEGMLCYDLDGNVLWDMDLGRLDTGLWGDPSTPWGHASSPVIWDDLVLVQSDTYEDSFLAAFRLQDGSEVWRVQRSEKNTWSTPTVHEGGGRTLVVTNGGNFIRAYDVRTGEEVWQYADDAQVKVPTPVVSGGRVIIAGGWPQGRPIHAIDADATGTVGATPGDTGLLWQVDSGGPYTTTPLAYRDLLYSVTDNGILSAFDLATGERLYRERLGGGFSASGVAGDGKLYFSSEDGEMFVLAAGREFELLASIDMGAPLFATPALSAGEIFVRTQSRLYAIGATS